MSYDFEQLPNDDLLNIIRTMTDGKKALVDIFTIAYQRKALEVFRRKWLELPNDVEKTANEIEVALKKTKGANGLYFGLDTLNMNDGDGANIEIQTSNTADLSGSDSEWMFHSNGYNNRWLINGLYNASKEYDQYSSDDKWFAEYVTFLSYSGIVIGSALKKSLTRIPYISAWGFHDGDMYKIAMCDGSTIHLNPFPENPTA